MSLDKVVFDVVANEGKARLARGLGLRWTDNGNKTGGTMSLSRKGDVVPSGDEVRTVMKSMKETLPPHSVDIDEMSYEVEGHQVVRLYVFWENENE